MMFDELTLKAKLFGLVAIAFLLVVGMATFSVLQLSNTLNDETENFGRLNRDVQILAHVGGMTSDFLKEVKATKDIWLRGTDAEKLKKHRQEFDSNVQGFDKYAAQALQGLNQLAQGHEGFDGFISRMNAMSAEHKAMSGKYLAAIEAYRGNASESDARVAGIDNELATQLKAFRNDFVKFVGEKGAEKIALSEKGFQQRRNIILISLLISLALLVFLAGVLIRQVLHQLGGDPKVVAQVINTLAGGDFSSLPHQAAVSGSLLANAHGMQTQLREMIMDVKTQATQLGEMAHRLASSAQQISGNVNQESDAVSNMAATIEEMSVSTTHIADQGGIARRIASDSRSDADQGASVVTKTVEGLIATAQEIERAASEVSRLGEDSLRISGLVDVIKDIADQTNLLALNAAIEAARAGEAGRGFAVVADEVRKLAERTANATQEINQMSAKIGEVANHALSGMDSVVNTTRQGVGDAESAQASLATIQTNFTNVTQAIDDISAALTEHTAAANDLARSTERVAQMSGENSSAAQGLLHLANDLEAKADQMRSGVDAFKV
ncbi:MAG: methyl-accepting chemotaxis protein [Proteobacteria bacterium]|nr:methyl-accepting chemotaxis protein [Pseudomonadota bacterium]